MIINVTSNLRRKTVKMYASAVILFTHVYTYDLHLRPHDLGNICSNSHSPDEYLRQISLKSPHEVKRYCVTDGRNAGDPKTACLCRRFFDGWLRSTVGGTSVFGRRTDPVLRSACSWRVTTMSVNRPLQVSKLGQLSLSSFRGR